ncbi:MULTISPECIES: putative metalloprotease CJM1_0395 family protein [Marinobacter]|uniref:putative metalloprotease CJM1_0395 family protein n=1 Tax=Marinobacter TaxID=2742 RepID=UPI002003845A|nr:MULTISPECIES: putative metalloprotease CJM1_0395 family protein [Marinobacter]MCK7551471.1 hypothetical protein [Marinobacter goseongensis]MDV3502995.1 putative metalloprotease CJM1_0395 family protein [Marinobacter sp. M-5]
MSPVLPPDGNTAAYGRTKPSGASPRGGENPDQVERVRESAARNAAANGQNLDEAQLKELSELKARDREVRAHETAHQAVGGQYAGAISYVFQRGPDGAQYAVGGEVSIDVAPVEGDPQATIEKMRVVRAAAMAPAEPSAQDRSVAAQAMQTMLQAQVEVSREMSEERGDERPGLSRQASETYQAVSRISEPELGGNRSVTA